MTAGWTENLYLHMNTYNIGRHTSSDRLHTCHMEDGLEAQSESADFERVVFLDAVLQHADSLPVVWLERRVIVSVECGTLGRHAAKGSFHHRSIRRMEFDQLRYLCHVLKYRKLYITSSQNTWKLASSR